MVARQAALEVLKHFVRHRLDSIDIARFGTLREAAVVLNVEQDEARLVALRQCHGPAQGLRDNVA